MGRIDDNLDVIVAAMKDACSAEVENDGMIFDSKSVTAVRITEDAEYQGVRVRVQGNLGNARISLQIDIGFGDEVYPHPGKIKYPALFDFPAPELSGYTMESTIAEKFQAMVKLGILNSRMKDFYDIWFLSRTFNFKGEHLANAFTRTFKNRNTEITGTLAIFKSSFGREKQTQWQAFVRKSKLADAPEQIEKVISEIKMFLEPLTTSIAEKKNFNNTWNTPGPWQKTETHEPESR